MRRLVLSSLAAALLVACRGPKPQPAASAPPPPPDPAPLVAEARDLRAGGDLAGARARLEDAHLASPDSDEVRLELADLLVSDGQEVHRARALLDGVRAREGARWFLLSARIAELLADDLRAEADYARALAVEDDPDARLRRAQALERLGRVDEATAELERVRTSRPRDALLRTRIGERYEAVGRLAEAESEFRVAAEAQPDRAQGWERLARFYEGAGRASEARAAQDRAREVGGRNGRTLRPLLPSRR